MSKERRVNESDALNVIRYSTLSFEFGIGLYKGRKNSQETPIKGIPPRGSRARSTRPGKFNLCNRARETQTRFSSSFIPYPFHPSPFLYLLHVLSLLLYLTLSLHTKHKKHKHENLYSNLLFLRCPIKKGNVELG